MNDRLKSLVLAACVVIDPIAVNDFRRWNNKRSRKQEVKNQEIEKNSPWPPPAV